MNKPELTEKILKIFQQAGKPLQLNEISKKLSVKSDSKEYDSLKIALNDLCTQKIIDKSTRRRYKLKDFSSINTINGILKIKKNRGSVETNSEDFPKVSIKMRNLNTAFDGDSVLVKLQAIRKGKKLQGEVIRVLERAETDIIGTIEHDGVFFFLIPNEEKYYVDFLVPSKNLSGAGHGDKVSARFITWDNPLKSPKAEVVKILGKAGEPKAEYDAIINEFSLQTDFPQDVLTELDRVEMPNLKEMINNRLDLRKEEIITIDPADAKDFDDALSIKILDNGNYILGVHIADVSYFVTENSNLDKEALNRGNSIYLVDRVIPMLPEKLSNELCSLKPNRIRLAFSVMMEFTPEGEMKNYDVRESIIKSKKRFNYDEVLKIIETGKGAHTNIILSLHKLATTLREKRFKNGGIDFDSSEVKFTLDEKKNPLEALLRQTTKSTSLVEECMLIANKTVAEHIKKLTKKHKVTPTLPFLYRVHDQPIHDKLKEVLEFIQLFGVKYYSVNNPDSKQLNEIVRKFDEHPAKPVVHQILLRAMAKAEYSEKNIGHYGLGFKDYTHFTSPIRRYPDLIVHRLIKQYSEKKISKTKLKNLTFRLEDIGEHCINTERKAMDAERASVKLTQTIMANRYLGKEFDGTIVGVMSYGMYLFLDGLYAEGLLHIRDLTDDYYYYDERNYRLIGKRLKRVFNIGKRLRVQIMRVDMEKRKIDLNFIEDI